ncbi:MAG: hypothetical protein M0Z49_04950 [Chloroflexi bacterium]|nr:hypothetical protein [Chloroflexota bacterium]
MDRNDLDVARLAAALVSAGGGPHSTDARRASYHRAQELYAALEDAQVTETSLAMAMHGAWCVGDRAAQFHEWSHHRPEAGELLAALLDPRLADRLAETASSETGPDVDLPAPGS